MQNPLENRRKLSKLSAARSEHYAFIIDRSDHGREMLSQLRNAQPEHSEFRERASGVGIKTWEESGYEFVIIWGTFGHSGGLTIRTKDIDHLLHDAIPSVVEKTEEKDGECVFFIGVDPAIAPIIKQCLAEIQPTVGTA